MSTDIIRTALLAARQIIEPLATRYEKGRVGYHVTEDERACLAQIDEALEQSVTIYEQCAVIAESATYRARWARGASDAQPIQPCEIAAAIRKAATP